MEEKSPFLREGSGSTLDLEGGGTELVSIGLEGVFGREEIGTDMETEGGMESGGFSGLG